MLIPVVFNRSYGPYNKGDVAGFLKTQADELIAKKIAHTYVDASQIPVRKGAADTMVKKAVKA